MNRITGDELMHYLDDRVKKYYKMTKSKKDLDLVKAHPSKKDINELIEDISKAQKSITGGTLYKRFDDDDLKEDIERAQQLLEPEEGGDKPEPEPEPEYEVNPELVPAPEVKQPKIKKDKGLINHYELDIDIKKIIDTKKISLGKAFEDVLLQSKYEPIIQRVFKDSSELLSTDTLPKLQGHILSTGMSLADACIYDLYSGKNVFELKNYDTLTFDEVKKNGLYINISKLYGSELYRPEFYIDDGEVKLFNVSTSVMTPTGHQNFNLFNNSCKTLHFIYNLKDGVYRYDISNNKEFDLISLLDDKGNQIKKEGKNIMVYSPDQPRVVQGTFLGKQCFVLDLKHLHKI
jgi:hypothetical protein